MTRRGATLAKLSRPRLYDALPRDRLFRLLDDARQHPLVWVAAPPGAGKTTLIASYLESRKLPGIWYQVDSGDSDPATFFYYLGLAAQALVGAKKRSVLPLLTPEHLSDIPGFARRYFRELLSRLPRPSAVVFDNFQELPEDSPLHAALAEALGEIPDGVQVTVISRVDAPALYSRYAANRALSLVDFERIKLTPDETQEIVGLHLEVDAGTVKRLHTQSGGWTAGLTLLLEQLRRGVAAEEIGQSDSMQEVFNYFADQIFDKIPIENQHILLHLAPLPRITEQTAERLTASRNAGKLLEHLYRRHLFTDRRKTALTPKQPRDGHLEGGEPKRGTYTYQFHALFRAFLQYRAFQTYAENKLAEIARHAAELLEQGGDPDSAVLLYVEARDSVAAVRVILEQAPTLLKQGRGQTLRDWVELLPEELVAQSPWLGYWVGASLANVDPTDATVLLERAFEQFAANGDVTGQILAASSVVDSHWSGISDFRTYVKWAAALTSLVRDPRAFASKEAKLDAYSSLLLAILCGHPENPILPTVLRTVVELLKEPLDAEARAKAGFVVLTYCCATGDMAPGPDVISEIAPLMEQEDMNPARAAWWWTRVAHYRLQSGAYREALEAFDRSEGIGKREGLRITEILISLYRFLCYCQLGDLACAEQVALGITSHLRPTSKLDLVHGHAVRSYVAAYRGDRQAEALEHGREMVRLADEVGMRWTRISYRVPLAFILLECGLVEEAEACVDVVESQSEGTCFSRYHVEVLLCGAYRAMRAGHTEQCHAKLKDALASGRKVGWVYPSQRLPRVIPELFSVALRAGIEVEYVRSLIRKFGLRPPFPDIESWPWPIKIHTLRRFEVELDEKRVEFSAKAPRKMLALLKALVCLGGREVPDYQLIDALWPDEEGDAARTAFGVAIHRLRKLFGDAEAILLKEGRVSLNPRVVWVDALAFERLANEALGPANGEAHARVERALALYQGALLPSDSEEPWSAPMRERLRAKFVHLVGVAGGGLEQSDEWQQASTLYLRGLDADELTESFYQGLMRCYQHTGRRAEALSVYRRMRQTLSVTLGIKPSQQSEALHTSLLSAS